MGWNNNKALSSSTDPNGMDMTRLRRRFPLHCNEIPRGLHWLPVANDTDRELSGESAPGSVGICRQRHVAIQHKSLLYVGGVLKVSARRLAERLRHLGQRGWRSEH